MGLRIFIWEGDGISSGYHDDGTLVVLAGSVEEARDVAQARRDVRDAKDRAYDRACNAFRNGRRKSWPRMPSDTPDAYDGRREALDREPDRVIDLDAPCVVSFNGGGYD